MFTCINILSCFWIFLGRKYQCSNYPGETDSDYLTGTWLDCNCNPDDCSLQTADEKTKLITSMYWVITTLTTVGYGDFKGYHMIEYIYQMMVEFLGIALFSFLMGSINSIVVSE
jgi:hypothetical protein